MFESAYEIQCMNAEKRRDLCPLGGILIEWKSRLRRRNKEAEKEGKRIVPEN